MAAPTVTMQDVLDSIKEETYFYDGLLTICRITMQNGTKVIGESACASPERYKKEEGENIAKANALNEIWPRLGYVLKEKLCLIEKAGRPFGKITELGEPITYVGTSVVHALPMNRGEYNKLRGWTVPPDEDAEDNGYVIQEGRTGHLNWKPQDVFEKIYDINLRVRQEPKNLITALVEERDQLALRVDETISFINSESFQLMSAETQNDLQEQLPAMQAYLTILNTRVNRVI